MNKLDPQTAKRIIDTVAANGIPPAYGFQFFTAGLNSYLSVIDDEYLSTFIKQGGSAFKMVVGVYGGGKTHFLYCVRDLAWKNQFAVSYVSLAPGESPFHRLDLVYQAIVKGLLPPLSTEELLSGYEHGIVPFIRSWYSMKYQEALNQDLAGEDLRESLLTEIEKTQGIESISFSRAVNAAFKALLDKQEEDFLNICQWLTGEGFDRRVHGKFGILQRIDRTTAFTMIRSLVQWVKQIGFSGLVILLDEAERVPSLSTKQRELHLNNLRELIDECGQTSFQSVMIFYAVPDENFLEGRTQIYEALRQRVATVFDELNPTGVKVELERIPGDPITLLREIGSGLRSVYEVAYGCEFDESPLQQAIRQIAEAAYEQRYGDIGYKRLFVQKVIQGFHYLRQKGSPPSLDDLGL